MKQLYRKLFFLLLSITALIPLAMPVFAAPNTNYTLTGDGANDMVAVAAAQEGLNELDFFGSDSDNLNWCAKFVCWTAKQANIKVAGLNFPNTAGVQNLVQWFVNNNAGTYYYFEDVYKISNTGIQSDPDQFEFKQGDLVIFEWPSANTTWSHVGIVAEDYKDSNGKLITWEGSTTAVKDGPILVAKKDRTSVYGTRTQYQDRVVAFVRPAYTAGLLGDDGSYPVSGGNIYFDPRTGEVYDCDNTVTEVTIPSSLGGFSVTEIGREAFLNCFYLTSISLPESIKQIAPNSFSGCGSLVEIQVNEENPNFRDIDGVLFSEDTTMLIRYPQGRWWDSYSVPTSVTDIAENAFHECPLREITLPDSLVNIWDNAFAYCTFLKSITIPLQVRHIAPGAFGACKSLSNFQVDSRNSHYVAIDDTLFSKDGSVLLFYPISRTDTTYTIPANVTHIGDGVFEQSKWLNSIMIPDTVTSIGSSAFRHCSALTHITIPGSVLRFDDEIADGRISYSDAVSSCENLTRVSIEEGVQSIGSYMFSHNFNLSVISIPSSVTEIKAGAFAYDTALTDIYYAGSESQWQAISINYRQNEPLKTARIHYNSTGIPEPNYIMDANVHNGELDLSIETDFVYTPSTVILARYDNDRMTGLVTKLLTAADFASGRWNGTLYVDGEGNTFRAFLTDSLSFSPLCESVTAS